MRIAQQATLAAPGAVCVQISSLYCNCVHRRPRHWSERHFNYTRLERAHNQSSALTDDLEFATESLEKD